MEKYIEYVVGGLGLLVLGGYHIWLIFSIFCSPKRTVIGLNAASRHQWVHYVMSDPKNGILGVQTMRNHLMASTRLATIAITLSSLVSAFFVSSSDTSLSHTFKYFAILLCFLVAFFCNLQSTRYYAHVSFLVTLPTSSAFRRDEYVEYVLMNLNKGSLFWSLGMRAFYMSFPLLVWIFGSIPMFLSCCFMSILLYFLDTTSSSTRQFDSHENSFVDVESAGKSTQTGDSNLTCPLLSRANVGESSSRATRL